MTIYKYYKEEGCEGIRVTYMIKVSSGDKNSNVILYKFIDHIISSEADLAKIPDFEKEAEKTEKELKERAMELSNIIKQLRSMGYKEDVDVGD